MGGTGHDSQGTLRRMPWDVRDTAVSVTKSGRDEEAGVSLPPSVPAASWR